MSKILFQFKGNSEDCYIVYASTGIMKCFEYRYVGHKGAACPHSLSGEGVDLTTQPAEASVDDGVAQWEGCSSQKVHRVNRTLISSMML